VSTRVEIDSRTYRVVVLVRALSNLKGVGDLDEPKGCGLSGVRLPRIEGHVQLEGHHLVETLARVIPVVPRLALVARFCIGAGAGAGAGEVV
jgi:citrate lyase beta subunit